MACPGLVTHTLAGLCALWLQSAASSSGQLHEPAKPHPQQTSCTALPQPPVQAPPLLLHIAEAASDPQPPVQAPPYLLHVAEAAFDLAVPHGMPRAGQSLTGMGFVHRSCRVLPPPLDDSINQQNRNPHTPPPTQPCRSPQCRPHHSFCTLQRLHFTLQCLMACPGLATHTLAGPCALWLPSAASSL